MINLLRELFSINTVIMAMLLLSLSNLVQAIASYLSYINNNKKISGRKFIRELKSDIRFKLCCRRPEKYNRII